MNHYSSSYATPGLPKPKGPKPCDCGMRLIHEDIFNLVKGAILRCGHCNSLIWYDETFWPDMENTYIRWSNMNGCAPLKISIWMLRYLFAEELAQANGTI